MASRRVEADFRARCCFETKRELRDRLQKVEQRESSYTDSIAALVEQQRFWGSYKALPMATAALEACSGLVGRAFSAAVVKTENDTVSGVLSPGRSCGRTSRRRARPWCP